MCGSRPLPEAVTRSTGGDAGCDGSAALRFATRSFTADSRAGLIGPRFEPLDAPALYPYGPVAEGRPQKYFASSNGCPISRLPIGFPSLTIKLPLAAVGKRTVATPVTASG